MAVGLRGRRLAALADAAERSPRRAREAAENELSAALALVDPSSLPLALVAELADAEARVLLARRFHNDAVRDTLALRERPAVKMLRLGGTAALPTYFEIAERAHGTSASTSNDVAPTVSRRVSARVVLLDRDGRGAAVLRIRPGRRGRARTARRRDGGSRSEARRSRARRWPQTAVRELEEETGLRVEPADMIGPVWRRDAVIDFNGSVIRSEEMFFIHRTDRFEPSRRVAPAWSGPTSMGTGGAMRQ